MEDTNEQFETAPEETKNEEIQSSPHLEQSEDLDDTRHIHKGRSRGSPLPDWETEGLRKMQESEMLGDVYTEDTGPPSFAPAGAKRAYRDKRAASGLPVKDRVPEHVRELMDRGVPVVQWTVLVVLITMVLYQIRPTIASPSKKQKISNQPRGNVSVKSKKGKKKSVRQRIPSTVEKAEEKTVTWADEAPAKKSPPAAKKSSSKKKKKSRAKNRIAPKEDIRQQTDDGSSDESASGEPEEGDGDKPEPTNSAVLMPIHQELVDSAEEGDWTTVSKSKPSQAKVPKENGAAKSMEPSAAATPDGAHPMEEATLASKPEAASENHGDSLVAQDATPAPKNGSGKVQSPLSETVTNQPETVADATPEPLDANGSETKAPTEKPPKAEDPKKSEVKEKAAPVPQDSAPVKTDVATGTPALKVARPEVPAKKEAKLESKPAPKTVEVPSTDNDEALALLLQKQEEMFARADFMDGDEEVWEEVTMRRRKGPKHAIAAV